jgi:hypothetical protein
MARIARWYGRLLIALLLLGATMSLTACPSDDDVAALRKEVDELKAYRVANGLWEDTLYKSYSHVYYCDTGHPRADCPPAQTHIPPPPPPPK